MEEIHNFMCEGPVCHNRELIPSKGMEVMYGVVFFQTVEKIEGRWELKDGWAFVDHKPHCPRCLDKLNLKLPEKNHG